MRPSVLIIGATSDIGIAIAHKFAANGHDVHMTSRDVSILQETKTDLEIRYQVNASISQLDVLDYMKFEPFIRNLHVLPEIVVCSVGLMNEQFNDENNIKDAVTTMRTNFEGPAVILGLFANIFSERKSGTIIGISSVAGDRGRAKNYVYGSSKAGLSAFLSGLRNRLFKSNVNVISVLPGFVNTKMTAGMMLPKFLTAEPDQVANAVLLAVVKQKDVVYVLPLWEVIMAVIKIIPEKVFKRLNL